MARAGVEAEKDELKISLATPANWMHLDLSGNAMASARRLVDDLVAGEKNVDEKLKLQFIGQLQSSVRKAREQGGVLMAFWSLGLGGEYNIGASVIGAVAGLGPEVPVGPDGEIALEDAVAAVSADQAAGEGNNGSTIVDSMLTELPAGEAVRVHKRQVAEAMASRHESDVIQYFVRVPGERRLVVLTFSTPNLDLAEAMRELFDAMALTLRWKP